MKQKSMRALAKELSVSPSYLSQVMTGKRPASKKVLSKLEEELSVNVKQSVKQSVVGKPVSFVNKSVAGGSAWESNPPRALLAPPNGFEVREAHRDLSAPEYRRLKYILPK